MRADLQNSVDAIEKSLELLRPGESYPTKPARGRTQVLSRIRAALKGAGRVIVATDMGREGHLIGMELVEHLKFRGDVLRANFRAEDAESIREAFGKPEDAGKHAGLLAAACCSRSRPDIRRPRSWRWL